MDIYFAGIEAFIAVAQAGSFTMAADQLNLSQTAISHRIRKLEENLGTRLIVRTTRRVELSEAGAEAYPKLAELFTGMRSELNRLRSQQGPGEHVLTVACLPTIAAYLLPVAIRQFCIQQPDVRIVIFDTAAVEIGNLVRSGVANIGLTIMAAGSDDLPMTTLLTEDYWLVAPASHPLAVRKHVTWDDLREEKLIRVNAQTANRFVMDQTLGSRSELHDWSYEVQHTLTAVRMVAEGIGLAIMPRSAYEAFASPRIAAVPINRPRVTRKLGIMTAGNRRLSKVEQNFIALLKSNSRPSLREAGAQKPQS